MSADRLRGDLQGAVELPVAPTEAALLTRTARGDADAFAVLYDATCARVHGMVLRVLRDPAQAEEVTQEVYLEVWRNASRFDADRGAPLTWLMTIAHRRAVDRVRRVEASRRRDTRIHNLHGSGLHDQTVESVITSMESREVRAALSCLTALQREAIELAYYGGCTYVEVAAVREVPTSTAKARIRDGLIRLRDALTLAA